MALGLVRAAQRRDDEAEMLLREAYDTISTTLHRSGAAGRRSEALAQFLRDRGRDDEAAELEARREGLLAEAASAA